MVKIGSSWYNIDVTFDLGVMGSEDKNRIRYDYFCRSDQAFAVNHIPHGATLPQAEKDYSYYRATGRYVKNHTELRCLIRNRIAAGMMWIDFEYDRYAGFSLDTILDATRAEITRARASSFAASMNEKCAWQPSG